ncbi:cytochrome P450 monooxygenase [Fusarium beomiforme]|uniref:Cytochrome P450 monooxygenase n=1 Tax=Fusarium beomiforme TaxID=44412 RepID=A0A9P5E040_9HYPO|nr:cytochrome P450 monooxygenase [Fusarium beomiforme]
MLASSSLVERSPIESPYFGITVSISAVLLWWMISTLTSPLRRYPGPFLAKWTNLWRLYHVWTQRYQWTIHELHQKYGPIVRIGPNLLDLDYPELIKTIYGTDTKWRKTEFYDNNAIIVDGKIMHNLFSQTSPTEHARMKKPIAKYYSSSSVLTLETKMNRVIEEFFAQLEERYMQNTKAVDLATWFGLYTWDMISTLTFSQPFGYMQQGNDFDGNINSSALAVQYFARVGQIPIMDKFLGKNPIMRIGFPDLSHITRFAYQQLQDRLNQRRVDKLDKTDFLEYFLDGMENNPDQNDANLVLNFVLANILAGADTTAITLRAVFGFLLDTPHAMDKLQNEILAEGFDHSQAISYSSARSLQYLDAVVRESLRMHPSVAMPLERYVPSHGLTLPDGSFLPRGTGVGMNPYIIGRNQEVWGKDANEFRPERWLKGDDEDEELYQQRLRKMKAADLTFGGGSRICLGRHIALVQIYKAVATLVSRYEIRLADPKVKMKIISGWFPRQTHLIVKMCKRPEMKKGRV